MTTPTPTTDLGKRITRALGYLRSARMDGRCDHIQHAAQALNDLLEQWPTRREV